MNVVRLISENVNTNKAISNSTNLTLNDCATQIFKLSVRNVLVSEEPLIAKLQPIVQNSVVCSLLRNCKN